MSESFPLLGVTVHITSLRSPVTLCWSLDLLWGQLSSNLLICVLASNVHSYQNQWFFFCGSSQWLQTQSLPRWSCGFNRQLVKLMGGFRIFFLSHIEPGFQLWLYFYLWIWFVHQGLLLGLPLRTCVGLCEGQVWRWGSCLSHRGSGNTRYSAELAARAAGNIVSRRVWKPVFGFQYTPARRNPLPDREAWQAMVHRAAKSQTLPKWPCT